jgi:hypothetical protein
MAAKILLFVVSRTGANSELTSTNRQPKAVAATLREIAADALHLAGDTVDSPRLLTMREQLARVSPGHAVVLERLARQVIEDPSLNTKEGA